MTIEKLIEYFLEYLNTLDDKKNEEAYGTDRHEAKYVMSNFGEWLVENKKIDSKLKNLITEKLINVW